MVTAEKVHDALMHSKNPLFIFDDDVDGFCSYLLLYKHVQCGRGIPAKSAKGVDESFLHYVEENNPDKIFILDISYVSQEFLDGVNCEVVWIDHHPLLKRSNVFYFNPLQEDPEAKKPTSWLCYDVVKENLWIAMIGIVGDWVYPKELAGEFRKEYPDMLPEEISTPEQALFSTTTGLLAKMLNFVLKGDTTTIRRAMNAMAQIKDPYEILNRTSKNGEKIYRRFEELNKQFEALLSSVKSSEDPLLAFTYMGKNSFTGELSNELLFNHPEKVIIVARDKDEMMRCSLRASKYDMRAMLEEALKTIHGKGGGHRNACGASIPKEEWNEFLAIIRKQMN